VDFLRLHPSSWLEIFIPASANARRFCTMSNSLKFLAHQFGPILNSHNHVSRVYIIEMIFRVKPWTFDVVNDKFDVWWNPDGLDGT
jgi:hypothetical protein